LDLYSSFEIPVQSYTDIRYRLIDIIISAGFASLGHVLEQSPQYVHSQGSMFIWRLFFNPINTCRTVFRGKKKPFSVVWQVAVQLPH
jgi:hypothetical protein